MNINTTITKHLVLFVSAALIAATGFAYDMNQVGIAQADFMAQLDYLPAELLGWL